MKITQNTAEQVYLKSLEKKLITDEKSTIFYLKDALDFKIDLLKSNFPAGTLHAIAIKTCNNIQVLRHIINSGLGLEAASLEEVLLAKRAGASNEQIVFDSPVKTKEEIHYCHKELPGILANANSIEELERYPKDFSGRLGLRINPLVENEASSYLNVSKPNSKFGVPINREHEIIESCIVHSNISCLHMHIGSGLSDFSPNIRSIEKVLGIAEKINSLRKSQGVNNKIDTIDIGGGLHFDVYDKKSDFTINKFVQSLSSINGLFENFKLITEFGSFIHRTNSFVVSNIEYVIHNDENLPGLVYVHVGADMFVRKVYSNMKINYPISVLKQNKSNQSTERAYDIVGPLCFAGDILFKQVYLTEVSSGDKLFIYDVGANTFSMWSGHCSRELPDFIFV